MAAPWTFDPSWRLALLLAVGLALPAGSASAQLPGVPFPVSLEVQAGALMPLGDWDIRGRDTSLRAGSGFLASGVLRLELSERYSVYGSVRHGRPSCSDCGLFGLDDALGDTGFGFGAGYALPLELPVPLRLDAGGIVHRLSFRGAGETRPSNWGLGGEAGVTVSFALGPSLSLDPALAASLYRARFEFEEEEIRDVNVRYLIARIGLRYRF
jgi:hypothetical protein